MIDLLDRNYCPALDEIAELVNNASFMQFCTEMKNLYKCNEKIEYSACSWEKGWNIKFKKSRKDIMYDLSKRTLFTVMVVVGQREKASVENYITNVIHKEACKIFYRMKTKER